ncbi:PREDICTED: pulmonary surfactant-associated protein C [Acanthisitta chloris]|uniref:pulmonary surfactant-associated protein C n=1 Tax=Acanthisitta chloris TaxID=57068 RepID=UPI0004F0E934|nr:PREDICTED: pulmonary surfactant-associated protein C [Acanthisitta chloris]
MEDSSKEALMDEAPPRYTESARLPCIPHQLKCLLIVVVVVVILVVVIAVFLLMGLHLSETHAETQVLRMTIYGLDGEGTPQHLSMSKKERTGTFAVRDGLNASAMVVYDYSKLLVGYRSWRHRASPCYITRVDRDNFPGLDAITETFQHPQVEKVGHKAMPLADRSILGTTINILCSTVPVATKPFTRATPVPTPVSWYKTAGRCRQARLEEEEEEAAMESSMKQVVVEEEPDAEEGCCCPGCCVHCAMCCAKCARCCCLPSCCKCPKCFKCPKCPGCSSCSSCIKKSFCFLPRMLCYLPRKLLSCHHLRCLLIVVVVVVLLVVIIAGALLMWLHVDQSHADTVLRMGLWREPGWEEDVATFYLDSGDGDTATVIYDYKNLLVSYRSHLHPACYIIRVDKDNIPGLDTVAETFQHQQAEERLSMPLTDLSLLGTTMSILCSLHPVYWF